MLVDVVAAAVERMAATVVADARHSVVAHNVIADAVLQRWVV